MHKVVLNSRFARERACALIQKAPEGYVASVAEQHDKRSQTKVPVEQCRGDAFGPGHSGYARSRFASPPFGECPYRGRVVL
jgi:hypothetical protein